MILLLLMTILVSCRSTKTKTQSSVQMDSVSKSEVKINTNVISVSSDSGLVITEEVIEYKTDSILKTPIISKRTIKSFHKYSKKLASVLNENKVLVDSVHTKKKQSHIEANKETGSKIPLVDKLRNVALIILILFGIGFYIYKKL